MALNFLVSALVTLLVVVDPVGLVPTFIGITDGLSDSLRRGVGLRAALIAGAILIGAALIGNWLLSVLAISLSAFRIAGGLLLFSVATEMVLGVRMRREGEVAEQAMEKHAPNIAAFPLAIPLMPCPRGCPQRVTAPSSRPHGWAASSASLPTMCCRACSACCWQHSRCNTWSTEFVRFLRDELHRPRACSPQWWRTASKHKDAGGRPAGVLMRGSDQYLDDCEPP